MSRVSGLTVGQVADRINQWINDETHLAPSAGLDRIMRLITHLGILEFYDLCKTYGLTFPQMRSSLTIDGQRWRFRKILEEARAKAQEQNAA